MIKKDFHGWTVEDTLREIDRIVGEIRLNRRVENAEFITGRGIIRHSLLDHLSQYNLNPNLQWGNDGVVVVSIQ